MDCIMWMRGDLAKQNFGVLDARQGRPGKTVGLPDSRMQARFSWSAGTRPGQTVTWPNRPVTWPNRPFTWPNRPVTWPNRFRISQSESRGCSTKKSFTFAKPENYYDKRILGYAKSVPKDVKYSTVPIADVLLFVDAETADFIVSTAKTIADIIGTRDYSVIERWTLIIIMYPEAPRKGKNGGFPFHTDGTKDFKGTGMVLNVAMGKGDVPKYFNYKPLFGKYTRPIRQQLPHGSVAFMTGDARTQSAHGVPKMEGTQITIAFKLQAEDFFGSDKPSYIKQIKGDPQFKYEKPYYYIDAHEACKVFAHTAAAV